MRIRHAADRIRRAGIITHRIALLTVDCVHRKVTAQRLVKVVGRSVRLCPVIKDIIRLVVRTRGFGRRAAVHRVRVLRDDPVLMARIRIRRIQHRHRVVAHGPACAEHQISGHRGRKVCRASVRILPAAEVKAGAGARRRSADCGRCNDRVTVDNDLRCRSNASAVRVKAHGIARQEVVVRKRGLRCSAVSDRCREGTSRHLFLNCHTAVHHRSGLCDVIGNSIHGVIVRVATLRGRRSTRRTCGTRKLSELVDIVACEQEAKGADREGTRAHAVHRVGLRAVCRCRHGQGAHAGNRRADCLKLKVEGLRCERCRFAGRKRPVCLTAEYLRECRVMVKRRHGCPECIEAHGSAVGRSQVVHGRAVIVIGCRCGRRESPAHELIARTAKLIRR